MHLTRFVTACLFATALAACAGGADPSPSSGTPSGAPSTEPTIAPSTAPSTEPTAAASLDPGQSDAGVVGSVTISGDQRAERDGTFDVVGTAGDGSVCEQSFSGEEFLANATDESVAEGEVRSIFVSVRIDELPTADGQTIDGIEDGRAGADFKSETFVGTLYVGEPLDDERTTVSIDITQSGSDLIFDFSATTWDGVAVTGQLVCGDAV